MDDIKALEKRISVLENLVANYIKSQTDRRQYDGYEMDGVHKTEGEHGEAIETNTSDMTDVRTALEEVYEMILGE